MTEPLTEYNTPIPESILTPDRMSTAKLWSHLVTK